MALTHTTTKQRPPKIDRPVIRKDTSEEDWNTFVKKWNLFKRVTDIHNAQMTTHLWQCCNPDLGVELFKDIQDIATTTDASLLDSIKKLAVVSIAASVRRTEFLFIRTMENR